MKYACKQLTLNMVSQLLLSHDRSKPIYQFPALVVCLLTMTTKHMNATANGAH